MRSLNIAARDWRFESMTIDLPGVASDELPAVLATGTTDVRMLFVSMSAREPEGGDVEHLEWHSRRHPSEQSRIAGLRPSRRLLSTPGCRAARGPSDPRYDAID